MKGKCTSDMMKARSKLADNKQWTTPRMTKMDHLICASKDFSLKEGRKMHLGSDENVEQLADNKRWTTSRTAKMDHLICALKICEIREICGWL
jgi:hypothetical protein